MADQVSQGGITVPSELSDNSMRVSQGGITVASDYGVDIWVSQGGITVASEPAPEAPSDVVATATGPTSIFIEWENNGINEYDSVEIERQEGAGPWGNIATKAGSAESHTDEGLTPGTTYGYRVRGERMGVYSDWSAITGDSQATTPLAGGSSFVVVIRPRMVN